MLGKTRAHRLQRLQTFLRVHAVIVAPDGCLFTTTGITTAGIEIVIVLLVVHHCLGPFVLGVLTLLLSTICSRRGGTFVEILRSCNHNLLCIGCSVLKSLERSSPRGVVWLEVA